jgi:hypothetical protein
VWLVMEEVHVGVATSWGGFGAVSYSGGGRSVDEGMAQA